MHGEPPAHPDRLPEFRPLDPSNRPAPVKTFTGVDAVLLPRELLEPYVKSMLAQRFDPRRIGRQFARTARGWDRLATALPGDIQDILEQMRVATWASTSGSTTLTGRSTIWSTGSWRRRRCSPRRNWSPRAGPLIGPVSVPGIVAAGIGMITWQRLVRRRTEHPSWVTRARELVEARRLSRAVRTAPG
jgi:ubiquinone biosynthesis protein